MIDTAHYHDRQFSILAKARTQFHLAALEAIFIKTQPPILCRQKEFVYFLQMYNKQSLAGVHTKFDIHPIKIIHVIYILFFKVKISMSQKTKKGRNF